MDIQPLLNLLVSAATALLLPVAVAGGAIMAQKMKLNAQAIKGKTWEETKTAVDIAIMAAEQQEKAGVLTSSKDKKEYALKAAQRSLERKKIKIDPVDLDELIEARVWDVMSAPATLSPIVTLESSGGSEGRG